MNPTQALNGTFGLAAISERTLSESDRAAVKSIYAVRDTGSIDGRILNNQQGSLLPAARAHVWIEDVVTGQVMASGTTNSNGAFHISGIVPGRYRVMTEYLVTAASDEALLVSISNVNRTDKVFVLSKSPPDYGSWRTRLPSSTTS